LDRQRGKEHIMAEASARTTDACYWTEAEDHAPHAPLRGDVRADVAIVGGGIVGAVAARLLADAGRKVALVEAGRVGHGVTGRSTAKVTAQHSLFLQRIGKQHGEDAAREYAQANRAGASLIAEFWRSSVTRWLAISNRPTASSMRPATTA
jgi:glycine/D-amino acid oxidase-like deaminating enzyme